VRIAEGNSLSFSKPDSPDTLWRMENNTDSGRITILAGKDYQLSGPELKVGDPAPDFNVVDEKLQAVNLESTGKGVKVFSVVPSLDTPVCDAQTKRFEEESGRLSGINFYTISMDLPFAQKRWCGTFGINRITMLSDHRTGSFGEHYGTLIPDLRIESRAIFVVDNDNKIRYVEYVKEVGKHPNYDAALQAAQAVASEDSQRKA
jgi:thioredoxin-dependent peroxiredoxin